MQEPVQDGGGEDFVAGEQFCPVPDALVGGEYHGATAVSVADQAEELGSLVPGHGVASHLVDHQQSGGHVFLPLQADRRQVGIGFEGCHQLIEPEVLRGEAELDRLDTERDAVVRLSEAGQT